MDITIDDNRNVYVVSDIHNNADGFKRLLKKIQFNENDLLIIDGDIFDRGDKPVELYFEILKYPNIQVIQGNHDVWVARQIIEQFGHRKSGEYISYNTVSIMEKRLTPVDMLRLAEWIQEKPYYINLTINGRKYHMHRHFLRLSVCLIKERYIWETDIMSSLSGVWRNMSSLYRLWGILQLITGKYGYLLQDGLYA